MADRTEASLTISAPSARIMAVIADVAAYPKWASGVTSGTVVESGPDARPSRARFEVASGLVTGTYTVDYTWQGDHDVSWTLVESSILRELDGSYALRPATPPQGIGHDGAAASATEVTYRLTLVPTIPLIGPLRRRAEQHLVNAAMQDLRRQVDELSEGSPA